MSGGIMPTGRPSVSGGTDEAARLRKAAAEVEGVFMQQMFKAMRETVPAGGMFDGGSGEEIFTGMLDEHIADVAASRQQNGLGDALYRQLATRLGAAPIGTAILQDDAAGREAPNADGGPDRPAGQATRP
jgi:flagellar protein FlgJ